MFIGKKNNNFTASIKRFTALQLYGSTAGFSALEMLLALGLIVLLLGAAALVGFRDQPAKNRNTERRNEVNAIADALSQWSFDNNTPFGAITPALPSSAMCIGTLVISGEINSPQSNLVGWWHLNENTGTTTVDASGNNNTGTLAASPATPAWASATNAKFGSSALSFDGVDDYMFAADKSNLDITSALTVEAWVKANEASINGQTEELVAKWQQDGSTFSTPSNYAFYDTTAVTSDSTAFRGAVFDGRYVYFVPYAPDQTSLSGKVIRYDTTKDFATLGSWSVYDTTLVNSKSTILDRTSLLKLLKITISSIRFKNSNLKWSFRI